MLIHYFQWAEKSMVGSAIRDSFWLFPAVEAVHLLALAVMGGIVLLVDLRLCGIVLRDQSVKWLAATTRPFFLASFAALLVTGALLMSSEALKCYHNPAFWFKMLFLTLATIFTFTIRRAVIGRDAPLAARWSVVVGLASITLWSGVGVGGRAIGFF